MTIEKVAARELTDRIRAGAEALWQLIAQAYVDRAWEVLGYGSWDDYCTREFGNCRFQLPREDRQEVVASMRELGMSIRAIAAATGFDGRTVRRDLGEANASPDSVVGFDGKSYRPKAVQRKPGALSYRDERSGGVTDSSAEPRARRRLPFSESFDSARYDLGKKVDSLARLVADDRFDRYAPQLAHKHLGDLLRARDSLQAVIDSLTCSADFPMEA